MVSKNEQQISAAQFSEISTIRNILMGQQMSEYEHRFNQINHDIAQAREYFTQEISLLSDKTDVRFQQLEKDINERFDRLERLLEDHVRRLDEKLLSMSKSDKNDLGKMLAELSKKLISE